jgi:hypothetical protein
MNEVEAGLETMEVLIAEVEPGFKESDWCAQEVGFALGRHIDVMWSGKVAVGLLW